MTISIRLSPELRDKFQAWAEEEERTLSWYCARALREWAKHKEQEKAKKSGGKK
ncbi:MAG: hypothetical protein ACFCUR_20895 [Rhodomicrobiaceae bacterium]